MRISKKLMLGVAALLVSASLFAQAVKAPFSKGLNLSKWFETWNDTIPNLKVYNKTDFEHLKELGVEVVRVPIHFAAFLDEEDKIKPIIFDYLDQACDWAEELGMYIIIDNHSFNSGKYPTPAKVDESLKIVWPQIANHFKKRSKYICYEVLNEPQFKNDSWEAIQADAVKLIRKTDKKHTIIVTGGDWGSLNSMVSLKPINDKNIIYTFHYYDPFMFTHQGADWSDKGMAALKDIPFPYDKERMPELTAQARTGYVMGLWKGYAAASKPEAMRNQLKKAVEFSQKVNAPVWCGELGVYDLVAPEADRNEWYKVVGDIMNDLQISYTVWGYDDAFGVFQPNTVKQYPRDLNVPVLEALRFNVPAGAGDMSIPNESRLPLQIYDDFAGKGMNLTTWSMGFFINDYKREKNEGDSSIMLGEVDQYGALSVDMSKIYLADIAAKKNNVYLCFDVKFTNPKQAFQVRFVDSDDGTGALPPYRLSWDVKAADMKLGEWNKVQIKIGSMNDFGGWSNIENKWYESQGDFSFDRVQSLEFAAENSSIKDMFYLDDIKIIVK